VGDSISARLEDDVSISKTLIAPRGALLKGHIREFQEDQDLPNTYVVGVEFDTLSWENYSYAFLADIVSIRETQGVRSMIFNSSSIRREMASGMAFESRTEELFAGAIPGAATFFLKDRYELPKGFEMTWRTRSLRHE